MINEMHFKQMSMWKRKGFAPNFYIFARKYTIGNIGKTWPRAVIEAKFSKATVRAIRFCYRPELIFLWPSIFPLSNSNSLMTEPNQLVFFLQGANRKFSHKFKLMTCTCINNEQSRVYSKIRHWFRSSPTL